MNKAAAMSFEVCALRDQLQHLDLTRRQDVELVFDDFAASDVIANESRHG
jgi:hypothetical protein